jgi:hypothetical protein
MGPKVRCISTTPGVNHKLSRPDAELILPEIDHHQARDRPVLAILAEPGCQQILEGVLGLLAETLNERERNHHRIEVPRPGRAEVWQHPLLG